jgi:hypothetical protein
VTFIYIYIFRAKWREFGRLGLLGHLSRPFHPSTTLAALSRKNDSFYQVSVVLGSKNPFRATTVELGVDKMKD